MGSLTTSQVSYIGEVVHGWLMLAIGVSLCLSGPEFVGLCFGAVCILLVLILLNVLYPSFVDRVFNFVSCLRVPVNLAASVWLFAKHVGNVNF